MSMRKYTAMMLAYAMAMSINETNHPSIKDDESENDNSITPEMQDKLAIKRGLSKFEYGDNYVYALNKKSADKKAKKKGYI